MPKEKKSDFEWWLEDILVEIEQVQKSLSERLNDNPAVLAQQLSRIEAWHGRMTTLLAEANAHLDLAEQSGILVRDEKWTDLDRRVHLQARVVNERRTRDILQGLVSAIQSRLILGMSLRKMNAGEKTDWSP